MTQKTKTIDQKCKSCGGNLVFSPQTQNLRCPHCLGTQQINSQLCCPKHEIGEQSQRQSSWEEMNKVVLCKNCGASVVFNKLESATKCPYCASALVVEAQTQPGLTPDAIIPFQFDKVEAAKRFVEGVKKKAFLPNKFKKQLPESEIQGIYIPTFLFDAESKSRFSGVLSEDRVVVRGQEREVVTRTFPISGNIDMQHKNVTIEASAQIDQNQLDALKPFDYSQFHEFDEAYLLGYCVENNDVDVESCKNDAREIMRDAIRSSILSKYHYDRVQQLNVSTDFFDEQFSYGVLPTYRFNYKYKNKDYTTFMNGQTGKIGGGAPKSGAKITFFVLSILLLIFGIFLLIFILGG